MSGGYGVATGGPYAWGLCYNKELSPSQSYCDESFKYTFPCAPGADYYGRGAIPLYWYVFFELLLICLSCCRHFVLIDLLSVGLSVFMYKTIVQPS